MVVFDEVFIGIYCFGCFSVVLFFGVDFDIFVYVKLLIGGLLLFSVILVFESVFWLFLSDDKSDVFLYGYSYMVYVVGC